MFVKENPDRKKKKNLLIPKKIKKNFLFCFF